MPAAAIKGILLSIGLIVALGAAALENPQIQAWLEQQRQKIAELLRTLNEELDPQSRRTAEAFAYEGHTLANDAGLRREASGSLEAAAVATGRSLSNPSTIRRIPVRSPSDADQAEERRRKGREYLAARNHQMYEMKQRKKGVVNIEVQDASPKPSSPTSFDEMVDSQGNLRPTAAVMDAEELQQQLPAVPSGDVSSQLEDEMSKLLQPVSISEASSSASAWQLASQLANPFGDEHAFDRSETPKPPVPPKVAIEADTVPSTPTMPGSFIPNPPIQTPVEAEVDHRELPFDEQLAIALSLSEAEAQKAALKAVEQHETQDGREAADLREAIALSLKELGSQKAAPQANPEEIAPPLIDVSVPTQATHLHQPTPRGHWEIVFDQAYSPKEEPLSMASPRPIVEDSEDELYRVTPQLTQARLATHNSLRPAFHGLATKKPYDPVREAAGFAETQRDTSTPLAAAMEASFYSAASSAGSPASTHTMDHEMTPERIEVSQGAQTPVSKPAFDTDSESETFASVSPLASRSQSQTRSEVSNIEVVDVVDDSDVDMLSEEGDGIATPDSWSEVGSRDGESEMEEEEERARATRRSVGAM
ncbi:hypothetical protein BDY17DRAFT_41075 [Neohortaea acidophila]|uniref:Uncharacterized protein n=1 Tax=Neohortaea acidophila TaxID=245834 RepID=A0A6A6PJ35_9PEZI|nr:uncharacterized protein BDY17DRAFT_41075 [Neohortaea acidophila]KAF2479543.1 hypothetical protein BDY17DRAFT_41075 [Neohortaea acidophila]